MRVALNPEQRAAVEHGEGPLLVLAGAGSGKTRVLTVRAADLIRRRGVPPERILAVTFTNKAAEEMRERVAGLLGRDVRGLWIGTFHSVAARLLRREAEHTSRDRAYSIYDEDDALRTLKAAMQETGLDPDRWSPRALRARISDAKTALVTPAEYELRAFDLLSRPVSEVYPRYQRLLEARNAYDFDDLLVETVRLLEGNEEVGNRWAGRFRHVLVDEYQDTNHAQYRMVRALAREHGNLCVVGDDDQCLVAGTLVTLGDGATKRIEEVRVGDEVVSSYGSGHFRPARVTGVSRRRGGREGIEILTQGGRRIVSTPEHMHFAGYRLGPSAQEVYPNVDTEASVRRLMGDHGLSAAHPHHRARSGPSSRSHVRVALCGARRARRPMHRISIVGNDREGRVALESLGLSVRPAKRGSRSWRFETCRANYRELMEIAESIGQALKAELVQTARLGHSRHGKRESNSLLFLPAASVRPGMVMFDDRGGYDRVVSVRPAELGDDVYDLNVEHTHNFVANGLVTHNSIYGWRGADLGNILDFERDLPGAAVVRLEENYRSTASILDVANAVIACNRNRKPKTLRTRRDPGEPIRVVRTPDERAEASWSVREIQALGDRYGLGDCAVLYRTNAQSRAYEEALRAAGLPYRIVGGVRFYERREIKDALAYLQLAVNPADDAAFERAVGWPRRGVGRVTLERLAAAARTREESLLEGAARATELSDLPTAGARSLEAFAEGIAELHLLQGDASPRAVLEACVARFGMAVALQSEEDGEDRLRNLTELVSAAASFDRSEVDETDAEATDLELFLQSVSLRSEIDEVDLDGRAVTLMTLHNAKGLEFPVVFVGGLEEGLFPLARSYEAEGELEEERRLFYVGVTRAMDRLYLTHADRRWRAGTASRSELSSFLGELPEGPVEWRRAGGFGGAGAWRSASRGRRSPARAEVAARAPAGWGAGHDSGRAYGWRHDPAAAAEGLEEADGRDGSGDRGAAAGDGSGEPEYDYADSQVDLDLSPGSRIVHPRFGEGRIVSVRGEGRRTKAEIEFEEVGRKKVMVAHAGLRPA